MADDSKLVQQMLDEVSRLPSKLVPLIKDLTTPAAGSPASVERRVLAKRESALEIFDYGPARARLAMDVAADAVQALARVLKPPPNRLAPGGVARDVIESASFALWLVGPTATGGERLERIGRVWSKDADVERKISNAGLRQAPDDDDVRFAVEWAREQEAKLKERLRQAGVPSKKMVTSTDLSRAQLDAEYEYRLYSGLSHGAPIAVNTVRHMFGAADPETVGIVYSYLLHPAADAYCRAIWEYSAFMGLKDMDSLRKLLERAYEALHFSEEPRAFFRSANA